MTTLPASEMPALPAVLSEPDPEAADESPRSLYEKLPDAGRLGKFIQAAHASKEMKARRSHRDEVIKAIRTRHWDGIRTENESEEPVNPLLSMFQTYLGHLLNDATPVVEPGIAGTRGDAEMVQLLLRQAIEDTEFADDDAECVADAILGEGIMYIARASSMTPINVGEEQVDEGYPVTQRVGIDGFFLDPNASRLRAAAGMGHSMLADRQQLLDSRIGNPDVIKDLDSIHKQAQTPSTKGASTQEGDRQPIEDESLSDLVRLWEVNFRHRGRWYAATLSSGDPAAKFVVDPYPIGELEPEGHRYIVTTLGKIPGFMFGVSPALALLDSHRARQEAARRCSSEIRELARRYVATYGNEKAVEGLMSKRTPPNGVVFSPDGKIAEFIKGGLYEQATEAFAFLEALGRSFGPNVDQLGGKDDPGDSATASSILAGNGATILASWRASIDTGRSMGLRRMAAILTSSQMDRRLSIPGPFGEPVPLIWLATRRRLSWDHFRYTVAPRSTDTNLDANMRLRRLFELLTSVPNVLASVVQLGGDPQVALRAIATLSERPEIAEIWPSQDRDKVRAAVQQMLLQKTQSMIGPSGAGPQTRVGLMNSDYSRRMPGGM